MRLSLPVIAKLDKDVLRRIREHDFSVAVRVYAEERGWKVHYQRLTGRVGADGTWKGTSPRGWPDLFMVRHGKVRAFELKSVTGRATPEQREWLAALDAVPEAMTMIATPEDAAMLMRLLD